MLTIVNRTMNGFELDSFKKDVLVSNLNTNGLLFDYQAIHSKFNPTLTSIYSKDINEFSLNSLNITFQTLDNFIKDNKSLVQFYDNNTAVYTFPEYNLHLCVDNENNVFLEVRIYSDKIKKDYEDIQDTEPAIKPCDKKTIPNTLPIIANKGVAEFYFGMPLSEFTQIYLQKSVITDANKYFVELWDIMFRFDNKLLTQIHIDDRKLDKLTYQKQKLNDKENLDAILNSHEIINRRGNHVIPELGMTIIYAKNGDVDDVYLFDKSLLKFWSNIHRPITSW